MNEEIQGLCVWCDDARERIVDQKDRTGVMSFSITLATLLGWPWCQPFLYFLCEMYENGVAVMVDRLGS